MVHQREILSLYFPIPIEVEIKDDKKVDFIKQLLKDYGLQEVENNIFSDKRKDKNGLKKTENGLNTEGS